MTYFNLSQNVTTLTQMTTYANDVTGGLFGILLVVLIFFIITGLSIKFGNGEIQSALYGGLGTSICATLFFFLQLISGWFLCLWVVLTIIALGLSFFKE